MLERAASRRPFAFPAKAVSRLPAQAVIAAPFGSLLLEADGEFLLDITLRTEIADLSAPAMPLLKEAARQFGCYFDDPRWRFSLPLKIQGTAFQQRVWQAMIAIPLGSARTYGQLARQLGSGPRAVAGACRSNKFPIIIPCHRVVASRGLGGYCGDAEGPYLDVKRWLLRHEGYDASPA